jgi:hypothetical protein
LADLVITFRVKVGGVLTNATSVLLSNAAGTAGVTRDDSGDTVVADGEPMINTATGVYQYTIDDAVPGVVYRYYVECVLNGTTYRDEDTTTLSSSSTLLSYLTLADAEGLTAGVALKAWSGKTNAQKTAALAMATLRIDSATPYQGQRATTTQSLAFPRVDGRWGTTATGWTDSPATADLRPPTDVLVACLLEADSLLLGDREDRLQAIADGLTAQSIGSGSESYGPADGKTGLSVLCYGASTMLAKYRLRSGRFV